MGLVVHLSNGTESRNGFPWLEWDDTLSFLDGGIEKAEKGYLLGYSSINWVSDVTLTLAKVEAHLKRSQEAFQRRHLGIRIISCG